MPVIIPTKKCDLRCTHCLRDDYNSEELDPELLEKFLKEFGEYSSQRMHSLTGGEPTFYSDLDSLFKAYRNSGHTTYIVSNAQSEKGVESVLKNKDVVNYMSISLDAANEEINDKTRGKGNFKKILENTKRYKQNGMTVDWRFVLHDENIPYLEDAYKYAMQYGITRLRFSTLHPVGKGDKHSMKVSYEKLLGAYKRIREFKTKYSKIKSGMNTRHMIPYINPEWPQELCTPMGSLNGLTLLPNADINFCCDLVDLDFIQSRYKGENKLISPAIGNYKIHSLKEISQKKRKHMNNLKNRRAEDVANSNLIDARQYICENCKFYHYKDLGVINEQF